MSIAQCIKTIEIHENQQNANDYGPRQTICSMKSVPVNYYN